MLGLSSFDSLSLFSEVVILVIFFYYLNVYRFNTGVANENINETVEIKIHQKNLLKRWCAGLIMRVFVSVLLIRLY